QQEPGVRHRPRRVGGAVGTDNFGKATAPPSLLARPRPRPRPPPPGAACVPSVKRSRPEPPIARRRSPAMTKRSDEGTVYLLAARLLRSLLGRARATRKAA